MQIDGVSGRQYSYGELVCTVRRVASGLHKLGVRKGDILAMFSPNSPEYIFMMLATLCTGASVTTINPAYTQCRYLLL